MEIKIWQYDKSSYLILSILLALMKPLYCNLFSELLCNVCRNLKDIHGKPYFTNYLDVFFRLYVLTTTANNPDVT